VPGKRNDNLIGKTLGKYRIVENLGSGGMAEVYKAYHPGLDRYVAIKVLHSFLADEEGFLTRFQREAKIVATFRHPNIVQVYDFEFDTESNSYYMVMEFVDGPTLKEVLRKIAHSGELLPLEEATRIVIAIANALDYAHKKGMVHRDIKPGNVILAQSGQIILTDFGIARMINTSTLTASGAMVGTPAYMAPEQGMGHAGDERADIYSLGAVLYQLVTGNLPFDADTPLGTVLKHINSPLTPPTSHNPDLSPNIEAVIVRALAKDPINRYQTAHELAVDLERAMAGETIDPISPELAMPATKMETVISPNAQELLREQKRTSTPSATPPSISPAEAAAVPSRRRIAMLVTVLVLIMLGVVAFFATGMAGRVFGSLSSPTETPTLGVTGSPAATFTPDLTATFGANATQFSSWMATYEATTGMTPTPSPTPTSTPTPTPTPTPTLTPDLTSTALAACQFAVEVVSDPGVWPRVLMPGQQFVKNWTLENTGTCAWPENTYLAFASGDALDVVATPEIEPLEPGETIEIQITLQASEGYDTYASVWQLESEGGKPIEGELTITYQVGPTPTPPPTDTPTVTPSPELSPTPMVRLSMYAPVLLSCNETKSGGQVGWGYEGGLSDEYRFFVNWVSPENELPGSYNEFEGFAHVATYFTTSGELEFPIPDYCCPGDNGHFAVPDKYEIVWYKVYIPGSTCPQ
jgi:serine/threonine protein kinase